MRLAPRLSEAEIFDSETQERAGRAAMQAAARLVGPAGTAPICLAASRRLTLLLPDPGIVARVAPATAARVAVAARELRVTRHLAARSAPVVGPLAEMPDEPFVAEGMAVTLWPHLPHELPADDDGRAPEAAATALGRVHELFLDYPGGLPCWTEKLDECAALLRGGAVLAAEDRRFLLAIQDKLLDELASLRPCPVPIHGDAHPGNVLFTAAGPLWTDFEAACLGPREWDRASLCAPDPKDAGISRVMSTLRGVCVAVWCSVAEAGPNERAAAAHHLARLRRVTTL